MKNSIAIIVHDALDQSLPLHKFEWESLSATFSIPHVYKVGGEQQKSFVPYNLEHKMPQKFVCVMAPMEIEEAGVNAVEINEYEHKESCTYVFGPDNEKRGWHKDFSNENTDYVTIDTPRNTELYSFTAATIVMWHRWRSLNGGN